jgi:hypothetical protein
MDTSTSPWREIVTFLCGGGLILVLERLALLLKARVERRLVGAQAETEGVAGLEKRVTVTTEVIDIYRDSNNDLAEQIRELRRELKSAKQENEILREMKNLPKGNGKHG